jgi:hypothetical protein
MNKLHVIGSKSQPTVDFDPASNILTISGESFPENSLDFYKPVIEWLQEYLTGKPEFLFTFKLIYFNTSTSKVILDILDILEEYYVSGGKVTLEWHYQVDDEDIEDTGLEFTEGLSLPCTMIEYE